MVLYDAVPSQNVVSSYSAARVALLTMLPVNALGLFACDRIVTRWSSVMETSGFVDWTALPTMELQAYSFLVPIVASALCVIAFTSDIRRARTVSVKLFVAIVALIVAVSALGIVINFANLNCPEVTVVESLASQYQAVTRFNRGYCEAWCRADPKELSAQTKSECDPDEKTVFDNFVDVVRINEWCRDAVTARKYDSNADYSGLAPFVAMQQQADGCYVTSLGWQLATILMHVFNFPACAVLVFFCASYWRDGSWQSEHPQEIIKIGKFR